MQEVNSCKLGNPPKKWRKSPTRWCPSSLAKLVYNSHVTMVYGRYNELVNGVYKPTNITGGHHPVLLKLLNLPQKLPEMFIEGRAFSIRGKG
jgi:hypothetical protein